MCVAAAVSRNDKASFVESRATLIVTPPAILVQWQKELSRHTRDPITGRSLKVVVYPGVRELCRPGVSEDFHLVHPRHLANADVVLLTFQTLMSELGHSDENPFADVAKGRSYLRSRKRYAVLPSPLTSVKWWRICLDEAQRVEVPTAASAKMARKLITDRKWCISGTPIGRGRLNDLYGLLLFLSVKPFDEKRWFSNSFDLSHGNALGRLSHLLKNVMWRSTKENKFVRRQMGIPDQEEKRIMLQFSSVEKFFYDRQYDITSKAVNSWTEALGPNWLSHSLQKLRAACCHPQVGTSGIGGRVRSQHGSNLSTILSMNEVRILSLINLIICCDM
jgi:E3 ubiquitin-protein ligase SHPRH